MCSIFVVENLNFARLFARLTPVFLLKKRPSFARLFTKMSPSEELVTLGQGRAFIWGSWISSGGEVGLAQKLMERSVQAGWRDCL